jgi:uncharacterized FlgJ-related protein
LNQLRYRRGAPKRIYCDNGSEFTSRTLDLRTYHHQVMMEFSRPGKPTDNGHIESFNGSFRDECLNAHWFSSLAEAKDIISAWLKDYNESRPHRALNNLVKCLNRYGTSTQTGKWHKGDRNMQSISTRRRLTFAVITLITLGVFLPSCNAENNNIGASGIDSDRPVERFKYDSPEQVEELAQKLNYTPEAWQAGVREVPRLYITTVPSRWRDKTSDAMPVVDKKRAFFRLVGPLVLHANELIQADRQQLESIIKTLRSGEPISPREETFIRETAVAYKVAEGKGDVDISDQALQDELIRRVDTLPPSLVLAQAAEESGWGTSRFVIEGNALFGMWTWGDEGIRPEQQRAEHGDHKIASYETPMHSVIAYMRNINTHQSYESLRARRAELRSAGTKVTGWELAKTLTQYSERGQDYVDALHGLMKTNMLMPTDDAYLGDGPTILLIPVGDGS